MDWTNAALNFLSSQTFGVIIGGMIVSGTNLLMYWQKSKNEEKKRKDERDAQKHNLRNEAYIKFCNYSATQLKPYFSSETS